MDGCLPRDALFQLQNMFQSPDEGADSDSDIDEQPIGGIKKLGPADLGPQKTTTTSNDTEKTRKKNTKDIWDDEEVIEGSEFDTVYDPRPQPEYDIIYKQAVTSEDMFLGMGNKNPATASCEDMVVKIELPGAKSADIELDVKSKFLDCRTPKTKLGLHLPHPVDHKIGKAQWDEDKHVLTVTLRMVREYDAFNF